MSVKIVQKSLPAGVVPYEEISDPVMKQKVMLLNRNIASLAAQLAEVQRAAIELQQRPMPKQKEIEDIERYVARAEASAESAATSATSAGQSAVSAGGSATSAGNSATAASTSETNAANSETAANNAKAAAENARDAAVPAAQTATEKAQEAAASEDYVRHIASSISELSGSVVAEASASTSWAYIDTYSSGIMHFRNASESNATVSFLWGRSSAEDVSNPIVETLEPGATYMKFMSKKPSSGEAYQWHDRYKASSTNVKVTKIF